MTTALVDGVGTLGAASLNPWRDALYTADGTRNGAGYSYTNNDVVACRRLLDAYTNSPIMLMVPGYNWKTQAEGATPGNGQFGVSISGGSLSIGSNTITLTNVPLGVNATNVGYLVWIDNGTGTAEACAVTGGSAVAGSGSGTLTISCAHTHSGAWTAQSAYGGLYESVMDAPAGGCLIYLPGAFSPYKVYGSIPVSKRVAFLGDGKETSVIQAQTAAQGVLDVKCDMPISGSSLGISCIAQQTAGGYGIRLNAATGGANNDSSTFADMWFNKLYECILGVNASGTVVRGSKFIDFSYAGIVASSTNQPDASGPTVTTSNFSNYTLSSPAYAALLILSTGDITFSDCGTNGSASQLYYGVYLTSTASSGLLINNSDFENLASAAVSLNGTFSCVNITSNHMVQFGGIGNPNTFWGILFTDGPGSGITDFTISGNVMLGLGASSSNAGINVQGHANAGHIAGNTLNGFGSGIYVGSDTTNVTTGTNTILNGGTAVADLVGSSTALFMLSTPMPYSKIGSWANGSLIFCYDSNSNFTAGGGTGKLVLRENGAWVVVA